ncbi:MULTISPECIES: DEAD/DEAH box helicase [unclassified Limnobacter]|uniref:DEAD/DEAH box helicase n=1 Tax=unclassified Limnobacter TaxID=2630203 RepID=UPI000C3A865B|nr:MULTISPECIES: DEAD/DEAH box helicase [unclassified Limnobacter]MAG79626.1 DEAD/DEAH box helicase [Sutterellaceae bacterium]MBT84771.1 DEAD/DEAH box helicase [Sutterellaceae bacterium]|tara:strand:+ start:4964 stop:6583 length:1620 start_codon:yes stop_codon:yes gene_type:complete
MTQTEPYTTNAAEEAALANVTFADFALHPDIQKAIDAQGYTQPTPIQAKAIPVVLTGVDVMGAAQTGTGKTAGFSLPILNRLMPLATENTSPARHPVRALILTPTRELADQVAANVHTYAKFTPLRSTVVYGGVDINPQIQALRRGVELVIATPGRLLDHVQQKSINLGQVQVLVLDEADRMLDMGFLPDLQRIINLLPKTRQNLLFSATFSPEIQKLARSFMVAPTLIEVARRNATSENIKQVIFALDSEEDKRMAVCHLIQSKALSQVIVFSNTKLGTARLAIYLEKQGVSSTAIHGDKTQAERTKSLEAFKAGEVTVLVATDVAARGLDIADLPCVINYDLPTTPEDYVHRIGRTGRAGAKGTAYSFVVKRDERALKDIEKLIGKAFVREELEGFVPGVRAPREERGGREGRSEGRGEGRNEGRTYEGRSDRRPARSGDEAAPARERRPSRDMSYQGARFNDNAPIHRDAEYERLRAKLAQTRVKDSLFNQPYQESKEDKAAGEAAASGQSSVGNNKPKNKNAAPVAFLLGGSPRN